MDDSPASWPCGVVIEGTADFSVEHRMLHVHAAWLAAGGCKGFRRGSRRPGVPERRARPGTWPGGSNRACVRRIGPSRSSSWSGYRAAPAAQPPREHVSAGVDADPRARSQLRDVCPAHQASPDERRLDFDLAGLLGVREPGDAECRCPSSSQVPRRPSNPAAPPYVGNRSTRTLRRSIRVTARSRASISSRSIPSQSFSCLSNSVHLSA